MKLEVGERKKSLVNRFTTTSRRGGRRSRRPLLHLKFTTPSECEKFSGGLGEPSRIIDISSISSAKTKSKFLSARGNRRFSHPLCYREIVFWTKKKALRPPLYGTISQFPFAPFARHSSFESVQENGQRLPSFPVSLVFIDFPQVAQVQQPVKIEMLKY